MGTGGGDPFLTGCDTASQISILEQANAHVNHSVWLSGIHTFCLLFCLFADDDDDENNIGNGDNGNGDGNADDDDDDDEPLVMEFSPSNSDEDDNDDNDNDDLDDDMLFALV